MNTMKSKSQFYSVHCPLPDGVHVRSNRRAQAPGRVYVMTNKVRNSVLVYDRAANGSLRFLQEVMSRGDGTAEITLDPFQSQGSVALCADGNMLLVVNAASGELTAFKVTNAGVNSEAKCSPAEIFL